jgi:hypothetical protein
MIDTKQSWRHPKELKNMAAIAQNHKQKVITNLQHKCSQRYLLSWHSQF